MWSEQGGDELAGRLLRFMDDPGSGSLDDLAVNAFRRQWLLNRPYRALCEARHVDPRTIGGANDIPAVSTAAFKFLALATGPASHVFRTSGTTGGGERRGEHLVVDAMIYRASLRRQFKRFVLPDLDRIRFLIVAPSPEQAPDSSLGFMMEDVMETFGAPGSGFHLAKSGLDFSGLVSGLEAACRDDAAVALMGTSFGLVHVLDSLERQGVSIRLPAGSRIMDTGGFKGRSREISREEFLRSCRERLGVEARFIVNEYGMTELCSQFYDASLAGGDPDVKIGPHWVRTLVIDPETGSETKPGDTGVLRHIDLANLNSVVAVETEDLGFLKGDGFVVLGRVAGAEPRGCSIGAEDVLKGRP